MLCRKPDELNRVILVLSETEVYLQVLPELAVRSLPLGKSVHKMPMRKPEEDFI